MIENQITNRTIVICVMIIFCSAIFATCEVNKPKQDITVYTLARDCLSSTFAHLPVCVEISKTLENK